MKRLLSTWIFLTGSLSCFGATLNYSVATGNHSASVSFTLVNDSTLQVTLRNTSGVGATSANDVLTGIYFTVTQNANMSAVSAVGGGILGCALCGDPVNVAGEWAFRANVTGLVPGSSAMVLGAADLGLFSVSDNISGMNRSGTLNVGNVDYGIVSENTNSSLFNGTPVVRNSAIFMLNTSSGFSTSAIGTIGFLYGDIGNYYSSSRYGGGDCYDMPEPHTYLLMGVGLVAMGIVSRKRLGRTKPLRSGA